MFGPVVIRRIRGELTNEEVRVDLEFSTQHLRALAARGARSVTIVDLTGAGRNSPVQRSMQSDWMKANDDLLRRVGLGTVFVVKSPLVRGALTAMFWLRTPPHPHHVVGTFAEALAWTAQRLGEQGLRLPDALSQKHPAAG